MSNVQGLRQAACSRRSRTTRCLPSSISCSAPNTWTKPREEGQALISFPQPEPWEIPHKTWHFDLPAKGDVDGFQAVRLFGYAATVVPRGGATLLVEGSPELVRRMVERSPNRMRVSPPTYAAASSPIAVVQGAHDAPEATALTGS